MTVRSDNPIRRPDEDTIGRGTAARAFAKQVLGLDASEGVVVGVLGPWGSGKTSFVNLARPEFDQAGVPVLEFNPWMFSGAHQLVESFFVELAAQLRIRPGFAELGKDLAAYGEMFSGMGWLPLFGPWIERARAATKLLGAISQHRKEGVGQRRAKIEKVLAKLNKPIIVLLDDIDRLSTSEIRDVFKLIRLTASFPNLVYIVAFDRLRVEDALAEQGVPGRDYLEKILQISIDLPSVPSGVLTQQVTSSVDGALAEIENTGPFDEERWPDIFVEIVQPLIRNMRDVRRYVAAVKGTVTALEGQVALTDVLGLEAVRVFLPDIFAKLHGAIDVLTTTVDRAYGVRKDSPELKRQLDGLIKSSEKHAETVRAMVRRLFPAAERHIGGSQYPEEWKTTWLKKRRVAHEDVFHFYLERVAGEGLRSFTDAEQAWTHLGDRDALDRHLRSLEKDRLQDVIASLETYEDQFQPDHAVPATTVLYNLLPDLPDRQRGMTELPPRFAVARVSLRLLRSLKDPAIVEAAVRKILPELRSLSSKLELITMVGYLKDAGHKLVPENAAAEFERSWRNEVRAASAAQLIEEQDVGGILVRTKREADPTEDPLIIPDSPDLTLAILRSARGEVRSQSLGNRAVQRFPQLHWDALIELYGNEATLREKIEELKAGQPRDADELLELADKYLNGWRPNRGDYV
jgi:hypothetical protein